MEVSFGSRLKHAWDAFTNKDPTSYYRNLGASYSYRPDRPRLTRGNERSIVTSILDVASIKIKHCKVDENGALVEELKSGLNNCLTMEANIDQTARAFIQDVVVSMFDEGCVAIVPTKTSLNPKITESYGIGA